MSDPDPAFVQARTIEVVLPDGTPLLMRPVVPDDKERLSEGFSRLSEHSRYLRFMSPMARLSPRMLEYLTEIDYVNHFALAAFAYADEGSPGVGVARYIRSLDEPHVAEAAVAVVDDYHRRGIGTVLLKALETVALHNGITCFRAYALSQNRGVMKMFADLGAKAELDEPGVIRLEIDLRQAVEGMKDRPVYRVFRSAAQGEQVTFRPLALTDPDIGR
ncbi:MAG TPA: GNAT family N-acetyltransferase [Actinomycetota bacterium]|nr:GNAT family N-acetyltransferase [Actinomycetota bacterium]